MEFDEVDLNLVLDALGHKLRTAKWNLDDRSEFEALVALKALEARILKELNGGL